MLSFKNFIKEVAEPKPEGEKNFKRKHTNNVDKKDHPVANDSQFTGGTSKDKSRKADVSKGEDEENYDSVEEATGAWKKDTGWHKPEKEHKDKYGNIIKQKNFAKHLAKLAKVLSGFSY